MFYCQPKNKTENNFLVISGSSLHFSNLCCKFFCEKSINNTFQIYGEKTQRQVSFKTKLKWINFRTNWIVLENHILKKQNTFRGKTHFPVIKNTIKQIHNIGKYEWSIYDFSVFLYANICRIAVLCTHSLWVWMKFIVQC